MDTQPATSPRPAGLLILNDPHPMRICPELALEIGLNESIVLLQLDYLLRIAPDDERHWHDGQKWTHQSLTDLQAHFSWWSLPTISRIISNLKDNQLILIENFNRLGFDRTQWFTLNPVGLSRLHSVFLPPLEPPIFQNEKCIFQNDKLKRAKCKMHARKMKNGSAQLVTTIPENTTETSTKTSAETTNNSSAPADRTSAAQKTVAVAADSPVEVPVVAVASQAEIAAAAGPQAEVSDLLAAFGIVEPNLGKIARGGVSWARAQAWIWAVQGKNLTNAPGMVVKRLLAGDPPPPGMLKMAQELEPFDAKERPLIIELTREAAGDPWFQLPEEWQEDPPVTMDLLRRLTNVMARDTDLGSKSRRNRSKRSDPFAYDADQAGGAEKVCAPGGADLPAADPPPPPPPAPLSAWQVVVEQIALGVTRSTALSLRNSTSDARLENSTLIVEATDKQIAAWLENRLGRTIKETWNRCHPDRPVTHVVVTKGNDVN